MKHWLYDRGYKIDNWIHCQLTFYHKDSILRDWDKGKKEQKEQLLYNLAYKIFTRNTTGKYGNIYEIITITTFNNKLFKAYGHHRFKETYNWLFELKVYNEDKDMFKNISIVKSLLKEIKIDTNIQVMKKKIMIIEKMVLDL